MTTVDEIFGYMQKIEGRYYDTKKLKKDKKQYQRGYQRHEEACKYILSKIKGGKIIPLAERIKKEQEILLKTDIPDFIFKNRERYTLFDMKFKSKLEYFGWINERAYRTYKQSSEDLNIPLFVIFTDLSNIGYVSLEQKPFKKTKAWNGNNVFIFNWQEGLPIF